MKLTVNSLFEIFRYVVAKRPSAFYIGWVGYNNLGDEAILQATKKAFSPVSVVYRRPLSCKRFQNIIDKRKSNLTILGGGTQIGENSPIEWFRYGLDKFSNGVVFGTGVTPVDGADVPSWLIEWSEVLSKCIYVGVRGSDSAKTLKLVNVDADILGDTACLLSKDFGYWNPKIKKIGINIGQSGGHVYGTENEIVKNMVQIIKYLLFNGYEIEFFCVWPDDIKITELTAIHSGIKKPVILRNYDNVEDFFRGVYYSPEYSFRSNTVLRYCLQEPSLHTLSFCLFSAMRK